LRDVRGEINLTTVGWISITVATEGGAYIMKRRWLEEVVVGEEVEKWMEVEMQKYKRQERRSFRCKWRR